MRWLDGVVNSVDMSLNQLWKMVKNREAWRAAGHGVTKSHMSEELNNIRLLYNVVLILPYNKVNQP